jgi:hypothetical protein
MPVPFDNSLVRLPSAGCCPGSAVRGGGEGRIEDGIAFVVSVPAGQNPIVRQSTGF